MEIYGLTDRGVVREANEDSIGISRTKNGITIAVVCDGMGGAAGGRIASEIAEETFMSSMLSCTDEMEQLKFDSKKVKALIGEAASKANAAVLAKAREDLSLFGMGCTLNAIVYIEPQNRLYYVNVGDSRGYYIDEDGIRQITTDHSLVQMMVSRGELTAEQAKTYPGKNFITRAIGTEAVAECDVFTCKLKKKACIFLCTDGLTNLLDEQEILFEVAHEEDKEQCCQRLLDIVKRRGAPDNVTSILVEI